MSERVETLLVRCHQLERMARALGVEKTGVHSNQRPRRPDESEKYLAGGRLRYSSSGVKASFIGAAVDTGMEATHRKQRVLSVKILYPVRPKACGQS